MKYYKATFTLFNERVIQHFSRKKEMFNEVQSIISSDNRFIFIKNESVAISSIQSVQYTEHEMEVVPYAELSAKNKEIYDNNPDDLLCEVTNLLTTP